MISSLMFIWLRFTLPQFASYLSSFQTDPSHLRVFEDDAGKMNLSINDVGGQILSVSQFTLYANTKKGNRPSFVGAGDPQHASQIYDEFNQKLAATGLTVATGVFGADMQVALVNDGPVTIWFDTDA